MTYSVLSESPSPEVVEARALVSEARNFAPKVVDYASHGEGAPHEQALRGGNATCLRRTTFVVQAILGDRPGAWSPHCVVTWPLVELATSDFRTPAGDAHLHFPKSPTHNSEPACQIPYGGRQHSH